MINPSTTTTTTCQSRPATAGPGQPAAGRRPSLDPGPDGRHRGHTRCISRRATTERRSPARPGRPFLHLRRGRSRMGIESPALPLPRRQVIVRPPRNSGHFRTESRPSLLANIASLGNPYLLRRVISKVSQGPEPLRVDFSEVDGRVFHGRIDNSDIEANADYAFALVDPAIPTHQPGNRAIGMSTGMTANARRFPAQPIVEVALTRPGGPIDQYEFKRAYRPAG